MQESYGKGVATHTGPESCVVARKGEGEALTGGRAGQVLSREIHDPRRELWPLRGADAVEEGGRPYSPCRQRETRRDPARSEKRVAAAGVDGETWQSYGQALETNLQDVS